MREPEDNEVCREKVKRMSSEAFINDRGTGPNLNLSGADVATAAAIAGAAAVARAGHKWNAWAKAASEHTNAGSSAGPHWGVSTSALRINIGSQPVNQ